MKIGKKIQNARKMRGLTQAELGSLANQSGDRIRSYESGVRTPKGDYLSNIAQGLDFPIEYFADHEIAGYDDCMQILFELEELVGLSVEVTENGNLVLTCNDVVLKNHLMRWLQKKLELRTGKIKKEEYELWKARFPQSVSEDIKTEIEKIVRVGEKNNG